MIGWGCGSTSSCARQRPQRAISEEDPRRPGAAPRRRRGCDAATPSAASVWVGYAVRTTNARLLSLARMSGARWPSHPMQALGGVRASARAALNTLALRHDGTSGLSTRTIAFTTHGAI